VIQAVQQQSPGSGFLRRPPVPLLSLTWLMAGIAVMREASRLVSSVQVEGVQAGIDNLFRWPGFKPDSIGEAWSAWSAADDSIRKQLRDWILAHSLADSFTVTIAVGFALRYLLRATAVSATLRRWLVTGYVASDMVENLLTMLFGFILASGRPSEQMALTWMLFLSTWCKWAFLALGLTLGLFRLRLVGRTQRAAIIRVCRSVWRLRVQASVVLVLGALVALPGDGPFDQLPDIVRAQVGEISESVSSGGAELKRGLGLLLLSAACVVLLCFSIWRSGLALLRLPREGGRVARRGLGDLASLRSVLIVVAATVLAAVAALAILGANTTSGSSVGVFGLPAVVGFALLLSRIGATNAPQGDYSTDISHSSRNREQLARLLSNIALAPISIAAVGLVRAFAGPMLIPGGAGTPEVLAWILVVAGVAVGITVAFLVQPLRKLTDELSSQLNDLPKLLRWLTVLAICLIVGQAALGLLQPSSLARVLNTTDILMCWFAVVVMVTGSITYLTERLRPMAGLRVVKVKRTPVLALGVAAFLVAGELDESVGYHEATLIAGSVEQVTLEKAFRSWTKAVASCWTSDDPVPMLLIAAPGGGIRAAYWTALGMERISRADSRCHGGTVFMASGVSGGSIGLTAWTANPAHGLATVSAISEGEPLSTDVAALLYRDLPRTLLSLKNEDVDRAAMFEEALVRVTPGSRFDVPFFGASGLRAIEGSGLPWKPVLVLNSTDLATGCRILLTHISGLASPAVPPADTTSVSAPPFSKPARPDCQGRTINDTSTAELQRAWDFSDFNHEQCSDGSTPGTRGTLSAVTAAHLSARFPLISPMGALRWCSSPDGKGSADEWFAYAGDGGYLDNSGMQSLIQVWPALAELVSAHNVKSNVKRVQPYVLVLENDVMSFTTSPRPSRLEELPGILAGRKASELLTVNSMLDQLTVLVRRENSAENPGIPRVQRWSPMAGTAGISAPLGWTLSNASRQSLEESMTIVCGTAGPASLLTLLNAGKPFDCDG
jgi:hypothetical protein